MRLAEVQRIFADALQAAESSAPDLLQFRGDSAHTLSGLALYRGNLQENWRKSLAAVFPVIHALVGDEFFAGLAREYGKAFPSRSGDLNRFGEFFPPFLAHFPHVSDYPYFPDVAALEWDVHRAHYAENAEPLDIEFLAGLPVQGMAALRFALHPACALIDSSWAVADVWHAHQSDTTQASIAVIDCPNFALVVRPHWKVEVLKLSRAEFMFMRSIASGHALDEALDAAFDIDSCFAIADSLKTWIEHGVFVDSTIAAHGR